MDRALRRIVTRSGEPVIRQTIVQAMRILGASLSWAEQLQKP